MNWLRPLSRGLPRPDKSGLAVTYELSPLLLGEGESFPPLIGEGLVVAPWLVQGERKRPRQARTLQKNEGESIYFSGRKTTFPSTIVYKTFPFSFHPPNGEFLDLDLNLETSTVQLPSGSIIFKSAG